MDSQLLFLHLTGGESRSVIGEILTAAGREAAQTHVQVAFNSPLMEKTSMKAHCQMLSPFTN